jgi:adenylate kinase family enzyme
MNRVIVLGRGGAGKSILARTLSELSGLPVVELDKYFWKSGLQPTGHGEWVRMQEELAAPEHWIMDGDLGPYDALWVRLRRADTVIVLDFPLSLCAWRALRRGPERGDFWRWVLTWRWASRPKLMRDIAAHAGYARLHVLRTPAAVARFLDQTRRCLAARQD